MLTLFLLLVPFLIISSAAFSQSNKTIKIGSKKFTENVILGEIISLLLQSENKDAIHIRELGGTRILWNALRRGEIDIYPEYTGTIIEEILYGENVTSENLEEILYKQNIGITYPLGFDTHMQLE